MKILHLLSSSKWTGAAEPVFQLCRQLGRCGHDVRIAFPEPFEGMRISSRKIRQGKPSLIIKRTPPTNRPTLEQKAGEFDLNILPEIRLNYYANIGDNWHDFLLLRRIFRDKKFDIIHTHLTHAHNLAGLCRGKERGRRRGNPRSRLIFTHHKAKRFKRDLWHRWLLKVRTDHVITHTPEVFKHYQNQFQLPAEKLSLLRGGIQLEPFQGTPGGSAYRQEINLGENIFLIGMVARIQKRRDHETLLRAFAKVSKNTPGMTCLLIGEGEDEEPINALATQLGIAQQTRITGYLWDKYLEALSAIDVFVYTSSGSDTTCRAIIEAMALGKPIIGVNRGAVPLLVEPEKNGYLFEPGNVEQLAQHMQQLIDNRELLKSFGECSRQKALADCSIERVAQEVAEIYERCLGAPETS